MTKLGSHVSKQALSSKSRFREGKWTFVFISSIPHPQESDEGYVYVVVNFLSQVIFVFLLFLDMEMYANEVETREM